MDEKTYVESCNKNEIESDSNDSSFEEEEEEETNRIVEITLKPKKFDRIFFQNESGYLFSVYKCLLISKQDDESSSLDLSSRVKQLPNCVNWAVILIGGGHFAAAIFKGQEVVAHKTFHRYTVRAKQGSSQNSHDSGKRASSGGATLRRHNETALTEDIQTLLKAWDFALVACEFVFIRAPGTNRKILIGGKEPPFVRDDRRLRTVPFHTGKPTFQEVVRIQRKLSTVECYGNLITNEIPQVKLETPNVKDAKENKETQKQVPISKKTRRRAKKSGKQHQEMSDVVKESSEDEEVVLEISEEEIDLSELRDFEIEPDIRKQSKTKREKLKSSEVKEKTDDEYKKTYDKLYTACKLGRLETFQETLNSAKGCKFATKTFGQMNSTLLHIAAQGGFAALVDFLLAIGSDPTLKDAMGRPPYSVARNKETRNAFRRFMARYPDKYDYHLAQIPSPLCEEAEKLKAEQRNQKMKEKKMEAKKKNDFLKSTESEKKVAFTSGIVRCWFCGESFKGKIPFEYNDFKFCTIGCLKNHRMKK